MTFCDQEWSASDTGVPILERDFLEEETKMKCICLVWPTLALIVHALFMVDSDLSTNSLSLRSLDYLKH